MADRNAIPGNTIVQANVPQNRTPPTHILAADLLVVDELVTIPTARELATASGSERDKYARLDVLLKQLLAKKGMENGDKISVSAEDFKTLSLAVAGLPAKMVPGGSTADILTTLKHLLGDKAQIDFLGAAGREDISDNLITEDLKKSGIHLAPGATEGARSALSFIFAHPNGTYTHVTYPGNAAQKLTPEMVTDARVAQSDTLLIPISLWSKFDDSLPDALLKKGWDQDKNIIVTMPRQARFDTDGPQDVHKKAIPRADVIVADEVELARFYKTGENYALAIKNLADDLARRDALRAESGKPARSKPATALIKHGDDSVTVLVAATAGAKAARYDIPAPPVISGKRHSLGVDDAMYAGFIAALEKNMPPQKAAEFAMDVAQTKFLYDSVRIPGPAGADKATQERWKNLRSDLSLGATVAEVESAIGLARTGVSNRVDPNLPRTRGQKIFDLALYPLVANVGVWGLSMLVTYHSNFNQNKANLFVKRSSWFKDQLTRIPGLGKNPGMVRNLNMIIWSFLDGSLMAPVVAAVESRRQEISRWIDDRLGTTPEDKSIYGKEAHRSWGDILKARATTFGLVIATYFTLNARLFPGSTREGILAETVPNSGIFKREKVESINGFVFDIPGKKIGGWLMNIAPIRNWAQKTSGDQLRRMAEKTGTIARAATQEDARYQIEGLANTGLFELVYTSLCTAGLFFIGKSFATKRRHKQEMQDRAQALAASGGSAPPPASDESVAQPSYNGGSEPQAADVSWTRKTAPAPRPEKTMSHLEAIDKSRSTAAHVGI